MEVLLGAYPGAVAVSAHTGEGWTGCRRSSNGCCAPARGPKGRYPGTGPDGGAGPRRALGARR